MKLPSVESMRRFFITLTVALLSALSVSASHNSSSLKESLPNEELKRLNKALKASDLYMNDKRMLLDSMTRNLNKIASDKGEMRWKASIDLSEVYLPMRADSALKYAHVALEESERLGDSRMILQSNFAVINALSTCGIFTQALSLFKSIDSDDVPSDLKNYYWAAGRKLYGYMRIYVEEEPIYYQEYTEKYFQYDDLLVSHLPETDKMRQFIIAERHISQGRYQEGKAEIIEICRDLPEEANLYGMAMYQLALVEKNKGNQIGYAEFLIKAAISDIKGCVKDGLALPALAEWLYSAGELNLAFQYINFALEDAMEGNVRMRTVTIATLLPLIDEAYREKINASRDELMVYFLLVTFLLILSACLVVVLLRMNRRATANTRKLARISELQESYIAHFIGLCSTYASRLQSLQKLTLRKLASGQGEDLQKLIKSGKFGEDQNDEFYKVFDSAILDIYPDYLKDMNALLRPEEMVELKHEGELTPELRIYAFVRLGVDESTRIAQMLNYSVSTVYAYRNRMRNKAIDRENFDRDVMRIGRPDEKKI